MQEQVKIPAGAKQHPAKVSPSDLANLQSALESAGVKYCLPAYVDIHGIPKCKSVPISHLGRALRGSELFTGAALEGLGQDINDDELAVHPDLSAVVQLPWRPSVAWMPGDLKLLGGAWPMCSRTVLKKQLDRAAAMGFRFNLGIECEFFLVQKRGDKFVPANERDTLAKAAYDVVGLLEEMGWLDEVVDYMNRMGWNVHCFDHEDANSQFEIDFEYSDALTTADRYTLFRLMTKEIARKHGYEITFMPKPFSDRTGSAAHFNMSLASIESGENMFADGKDARGIGVSKLAYQFIAGVLKHADAVVATACSTVNSYKRLIKTGSRTGATWAPVYVSYGNNNRTHMIRIPKVNPSVDGHDPERVKALSSMRVECRAVDPTMNPYLTAAMMLGAGLDGIEQRLDPGDPIQVNMYDLSDEQLDERNVRTLPRTLGDAIELFAKDSLSASVMGQELADAFIKIKRQEWWDYHRHVSDWEVEQYLTKF